MQILGFFFVHGISYRPTDLSLLKEFSKKKSVLKIFIILFEHDCPEAVHDQSNFTLETWQPILLKWVNDVHVSESFLSSMDTSQLIFQFRVQAKWN